MPHPFQCFLSCRPSAETQFLVAACGAFLHVFDVEGGRHLSTWSQSHDLDIRNEESIISDRASLEENDDQPPPRKRPKLSPAESESSSAEIVLDKWQKQSAPPNPPFVKLCQTKCSQYVIAVTGDDKAVRVYKLHTKGSLWQMSLRVMPKRPCALAMTPDDATILVADKFGDVYAMPLLGQPVVAPHENGVRRDDTSKDASEAPKPFEPSATTLTVHTKRNRRALLQQEQQKMKPRVNPKPARKEPSFEHQLILGHVSLLTDILCKSMMQPQGSERTFILTSDRDEHIRVSRGPSQAFLIESYCLGHVEFVSKMCLVPWRPELLISGGGDDFLLLWEWQTGKAVQKIDMNPFLKEVKSQLVSTNAWAEQDLNDLKCAISHLICPQGSNGLVLFSMESIPAVFSLKMTPHGVLEYLQTMVLGGNILDMGILRGTNAIICSLDCLPNPGSSVGTENGGSRNCLETLAIDPLSLMLSRQTAQYGALVSSMQNVSQGQEVIEGEKVAKGKSLRELLYPLETLRKRDNDDLFDRD